MDEMEYFLEGINGIPCSAWLQEMEGVRQMVGAVRERCRGAMGGQEGQEESGDP